MKLLTPWKYNLLAPLIPKALKPWVREMVMIHAVKNDMFPVPERVIFPKFIHEGDTVVDIGANMGSYTTAFSRLVGFGKVYAFEPVTPTYVILWGSTEHLPNVRRCKVALSDHQGKGTIRLLKGDETVGEVSLFRSTLESFWMGDSTKDNTEEVDLCTLDDMGLEPSFIKCDAEGHDWKVIQGADKTTRKFRPVWMVEIMGEWFKSPIFKYFNKLKYLCEIQSGNGLRPPSPDEFSPTQNYFFIPREKL